jgi:peptidoglycan/LPS O-acetylase OafA/YrhL
MGIYRLLLAVGVLLTHLHIRFFGRNIGVFAVVSFFLLSGYVMTALIDRHYSNFSRLQTFYLDRAMRLFPQFILYMLLTLVLIAVAHPVSPYISGLTPAKIAINVSMLPLNFYRSFADGIVIPQSWSLGLESQFYIVIPLIIVLRARGMLFIASAMFFVLPYLGIIDSDMWGYRMLPGTLFMFLFGSFLYRRTSTAALVGAYLAILVLFVWVAMHAAMQRPFMFEVLAGLLFGIPVILALSKIRFGALESFAGNLSYGVFLNQFFIFWVFQSFGLNSEAPWYPYAAIAASVGLAALSYALIERPVIALRRSVRMTSASKLQDLSARA